jgi:hypothetical protein
VTNLIIAVVLCVAVAIAYAVAALLQARYASLAVRELLRMPVLWVAIFLNALGAALHVTSLAFGPLSLIQPLGVLTLVIAVPFSAMAAKRRMTGLEVRGMTSTVIGLAGLAMLITTTGVTQTLTDAELVGLVVATAVLVTGLGVTGRRAGASGLWEAVAGGVAYSVCSALCQTAVVSAGEHGVGVFLRPVMILAVVAIVVFAVSATLLTHRSYRDGLGAPLAMTNLVNPASATAIGVIFLGESLATTPVGFALAAGFALLAGYGVAQLARAREVTPDPAPAEPQPVAA